MVFELKENQTFNASVLRQLIAAGVIGSLISLLALFSNFHLVFDLLANFRVQYVALIFIMLCLTLFGRRYIAAVVLVCCLLVHVAEVYRSQYSTVQSDINDGVTMRVMSSNLLAQNPYHQKQIDYISEIDPDVVVFQEYSRAWHRVLSIALDKYPYRVSRVVDNPFGIAMYSKIPLDDAGVITFVDTRKPSVEGWVRVGDKRIRVVGTHPPPPMSGDLYRERNRQLQMLGKIAQAETAPMVVLGDLNITPWSGHFKKLLKTGQLVDARRGFGVLPTWPSSNWPLQIPIDHILVKNSVSVLTMETSDALKSDHKTLWADISF